MLARRILARGVGDQSVGRIHRLQEVVERGTLEPLQHHIIAGPIDLGHDHTIVGHVSPDHAARTTRAQAGDG